MIIGVAVGVSFALKALNENIMFFFSPADIQAGKAPPNKDFRVGGMVVDGSVSRPGEGLTVEFDLTDNASVVTVKYTGILPDLFREGQGIVANGRLNEQGVTVLVASHDLPLIRSMGQRVLVLSGGELVDDIPGSEVGGGAR